MNKDNNFEEEIFADELAKNKKLKIDMTYNEYLIVNVLSKFKINQAFSFNSNAELIKNLFNFNYYDWQKETFELSDKITLWMISIENTERKYCYYWDDSMIVDYSPSDLTKHIKPIRIVFEIDIIDGKRQYIYRGLFTLDNELSTTEKRYYKSIELE